MKYAKTIDRVAYDVVVIGSGLGGLVCAADLATQGLSVLVAEQHHIPGGATSMFRRKGFWFEAGAHRLSGIQGENTPLGKLLKRIGSPLEIERIDPINTIKMGDTTFVTPKDVSTYQHDISELFPTERSAIARFFEDMIQFTEGLNYVRTASWVNPVTIMRKYRVFGRYSNSTVHQFMYDHFDNHQLISILAVLGNYMAIPIEKQSMFNFGAIWQGHHFGEGTCLVKGGTKVLIDTLVSYIEKMGGRVVVSNKVRRIVTDKGTVRGIELASGQRIAAPVVVSNASDEVTYHTLLSPNDIPSRMRHRINKQIHSGCFFQLYLGLHEDADAPFETVSTFILAPSEIDTPDTYFQRVAAWDVDAITSHGLITVEGPEKSPKGYRSVNISCLVPYKHPEDWFVRGGDKSKYRKYKQLLADRIIDSMTSHIPRLRERIVVTETATPLTLERYTSATQGAIQGLAHTPQQSGKRRGKFKTCIEGLYRVGQYVSPGAGIAPVSISGALCAEEIMKNNR